MATKKLEIIIAGDASGAKRAFADTEDAAGKAGDGIVAKLRGKLSGLSSLGSSVLGGLVGGGVVAGFSSLEPAIAGVVSEYQESIKVGAQTNAVINSTGGVAHVTAKHVESLSSSLSEKIGIDDEVIQRSENMLLTFTNVRNEVGMGNKVYDQAVKLSQDMAVALGTDSKSAAMQLGKALNDPIKGVSRLTRAGVTFTQQQKDQIVALQSSGNLLGAQKIILGEVSKEFGGSAAAQATFLDKMKVKFANFQEGLGRWTAETAVPWLREMWPKVEQEWSQGVAKVRQIIEPFVNIVQTLWHQFGDNLVNFAKGAWNAIKDVVQGAFTVIKGIVDFFSALLQGDFSGMWSALGEIVSGAWQLIVGLVENAWNSIKAVFGIAWEALTQIMGGLWDTLKGLVSDAWNGITSTISGAWSGIVGLISSGVDEVVGFFSALPGRIASFAWNMLLAGASLGSSILDGIKNAITGAIDWAGDVGVKIANAVIDAFNSVVHELNDLIPDVSFLGVTIIPDNPIPRLPHLASGVRNFAGGLALVGEQGPELVNLPAGADVYTAGDTRRLANGTSSISTSTAGPAIYVTVQGSVIMEQQLDEVIATSLARWERHNGRLRRA